MRFLLGVQYFAAISLAVGLGLLIWGNFIKDPPVEVINNVLLGIPILISLIMGMGARLEEKINELKK